MGVFSTSLSREYELAVEAFELTQQDLVQLIHVAIDCTFASDAEKQQLRAIVSQHSWHQ
jgi:adenosine deaminase